MATIEFLFILFLVSKCSSQIAPKVAINFPDAADVDFNNETLAIISNSNSIFELECNASYPVEWIFHYSEEDDGTSEKVKRAETHRFVDNFNDLESYKYQAKIRLEYNGKLLVFANFTCRSTLSDREDHQTHVYMTDRNRKSLIILEISNQRRYSFQDLPLPENINDCSRAVATSTYEEEVDWVPCMTCETPNRKELELDYEFCRSPIQCNSMHSRINKKKNCLRLISWEDRDQSPPCKRFGESELEFNAKLLLCKNFGAVLRQLHFFGIFKGDDEKNESAYGPPIYYDWSEIDPLEMIHLHPIRKDVYRGENINFTCEYSTFYFSLGSWFKIENEEGEKYIKGKDLKPCGFGPKQNHYCSEDIIWRGTYSAQLDTSFDTLGSHTLSCIGPVWNTTEWVTEAVTFNVQEGETAKVISVVPDKPDDFIIGQRNRSLRCNFMGKPVPEVEWTGPTKTYKQTDEDNFSEIKFSEIGYQTAGTYKCKVVNFLGIDEMSFKLESIPETTKLGSGGIAGICIACLVVLVVVLAVILRMRKIILQQKEALRLLTEAEIEEFIHGNPELIQKGGNDYFDNPTVIDALPYDQKYEIPPEKLSIDYTAILGSGEYGLVLKGKVNQSNATNYINIALSREIEQMTDSNGEFIVAIKICKKDVDVVNFKALLSEVKIMAFLGHHRNIVSLIGASTQNIRNRELFIAVEYCHNGSLETYVRRNKNCFLNKVKYGFFSLEDDQSQAEKGKRLTSIDLGRDGGGDNNGYLDAIPKEPILFSSVELFSWTRDIAEAMDFIHSKKVIHGDLAIRNVLLTKDLSAKVGDFGLSRRLVESASYTKKTQCALPWRSMAIESLRNLEFSIKSDMWSLAVTLWELYTLGDLPYPGLTYTMDFVQNLENGFVRLSKPPFATNDIYEFMLMCWEKNPADRPTPSEIKVICNKLLLLAREKAPNANGL